MSETQRQEFENFLAGAWGSLPIAAMYLSMSPQVLSRKAREKKVRCGKIEGQYRFLKAELDADLRKSGFDGRLA